MEVWTAICGLGLVLLMLGGLALGHGYLAMGYRWSGEPAASVTGRIYPHALGRTLMRSYIGVLAVGVVLAAIGLLGLLAASLLQAGGNAASSESRGRPPWASTICRCLGGPGGS